MQLKKTVAAVVLGLGFAAFAQAADKLGTLDGTNKLFGDVWIDEKGAFESEWIFDVATALKGDLLFWDIKFGPGNGSPSNPHNMLDNTDLWVYVYKGDVATGTLVFGEQAVLGLTSTGAERLIVEARFPLDSPIPDYYTLLVTGTAIGSQGGGYNFVLTAGVVPEPAEYAMLLAGLGVVGMVARRRKMNVN